MKQKDRLTSSLKTPKIRVPRGARHAALLAALCLLVAAGAALTGCSRDLGKMHANLPPETGVFVSGPVDTVLYSVKLYWWGQDSDGEVIGFYYQWTLNGAEPVEDGWIFTAAKNKDFVLPVPDGYALQTFWVKAIDNKNAEDPSPATQNFPVRNSMPSVAFEADALPDTTLPAVSFYWHGTDPDGNASVVYYVIWLDGQEDTPLIVAGSDTTLGPDYITTYGNRTVYVRAVDEAQGASPVISHTWHVLAPIGHVLIVDDVPPSVAGDATTDAFYTGVVDSLTHSQYTLFDVANQGAFRSPREISLVLPLFDQVVWYGDIRSTPSAGLSMGQPGIAEFLDNGGGMYVEGVAVLGDNGSFTSEFAAQYLGVDSLHTHYVSLSQPHSTNYGLNNGWVLQPNVALELDSLRVQGILGNCEVPYPSSSAEPLFYVLPGTYPDQPDNYYFGTLMRGGVFKTACVTFPIRRCNGFGTARQEVAKILTLIGVGQ